MERDSLSQQKAQLDKAEREHLEDVVEKLRSRVEDNVRFQLTQKNLDKQPENVDSLGEDTEQLVEAIQLEAVDGHTWNEAFEKYITSVGYTIVNRLAALRCMEVRNFVNEEVTVFKENGLTPAAETLVHEEFLLEDEAILEAYHNQCDELTEEIEILFDRSSAYSLVDPDEDTFEELCRTLDEVPDKVWRADDVLGWVYEYYNVKLLDDLRRKGSREGLEPEDVPPANQFYTPHWVVRMLTDNSLGKLYLEHTGELGDVVEQQMQFSPDERKNRSLSPDESSSIADFCTYLVPSGEEGEPTDFEHPEELRIIDPACGSGHFLLYAFDVLERIWRAETDLAHKEIPRKILQHNLYGVDLDMRACQLAAFNLYLKGRTRAETEGANGFEMPDVGIVCADAKIANVAGAEEVFSEVSNSRENIESALENILAAFEEVHGLGSLLDVRGTLGEMFEDGGGGQQLSLTDDFSADHTLSSFLHTLRDAIAKHHEGESFLAQDLRSFVRLLDILAQDYDVALMNPPYGSRNRMPKTVRSYVEDHYDYTPEFYINFFEVCDRVLKPRGRVGMLVPRSFMFKRRFEGFRKDFVGELGSFDFLAEYGLGVLDNATVRTVGTVIRDTPESTESGSFIRLHDLQSKEKERAFTDLLSGSLDDDIRRKYTVEMSEFGIVPGAPISYWVPSTIRNLHSSEYKLDPEAGGADGTPVAVAANGMNTGDNDRFLFKNWEVSDAPPAIPYAKGGSDAWILPRSRIMMNWAGDGSEVARFPGSVVKNEELFGKEGLTWTYAKETGRRFGYFPEGGAFDGKGSMLFPSTVDPWKMMAAVNSTLYHNLFLSLTPERDWQVGDVGRIPWRQELSNVDELERLAKEQYSIMLQNRVHDVVSPYYIAPELVPEDNGDEFFYEHPHNGKIPTEADISFISGESSQTLTELAREAKIRRIEREERLEELSERIDKKIYEILDIPGEIREELRREVFLRTGANPEDRETQDIESLPEVPEDISTHVKSLVHHFAMVAIREEDDGIIPIYPTGDQATMLDRIIDQFYDVYGDNAEERLIEADDILGSKTVGNEAYPNLRQFIESNLFDYHVNKMENSPTFWKFTTSRLVSDAQGEGFACFADYHSLDSVIFDRLTTQYIEPRKAELRERRSAANRRRSDDSISPTEQARATEEYEHHTSALEQISVFEEVLQDLSTPTQRNFTEEQRSLSSSLSNKVENFREETERRLAALDKLRDNKSEDWFEDTFSPGFWDKVQEWRDEWIDALSELERACDAYSQPADEPVPAHLADLFGYYNDRLMGSDHYSSTGILFMTYYFEREGSEFLNQNAEPRDGLRDEYATHLAILAARLDRYKELAEDISDDCKALSKAVPSNWSDRAESEIMTNGYQPNRKHGVEVNIKPLSNAKIVPKIVETQVI